MTETKYVAHAHCNNKQGYMTNTFKHLASAQGWLDDMKNRMTERNKEYLAEGDERNSFPLESWQEVLESDFYIERVTITRERI